MKENRADGMREAITKITKRFGKGAIMPLGGSMHHGDIAVIPTGSICLDAALGVGGLPRGRVIEIFGPESSGKTTLALQALAEAQKGGGSAAFVDAEHALDPSYSRKLGVDVDRLLVSQPGCGEEALEIMDILVRNRAVDMVVLDSVAALVPRAELEGDMGASHVGLQARLMSQALRKLTATINRSKTVVIFINQIREKIGVMFGSPETTSGGRALKFYSSIRLDIRRREILKEAGLAIGNRVRVKVVKNKVAPPFREVELEIRYGLGICQEADLLQAAVNRGVVTQRGSWFYFGKEKLSRGKEGTWMILRDKQDIRSEVERQVRETLKGNGHENKTEAEPKGSAPVAA
ncbi:MAG: recombinase RecA [bacterium]|nr:recombinase RecA [bacterium]